MKAPKHRPLGQTEAVPPARDARGPLPWASDRPSLPAPAACVSRLIRALAILAALPALSGVPLAAAPVGRVPFDNSIKAVPVGAAASQPHRVRDLLTADELAQSLGFLVSLRMPRFDELEARVHAGHTVPQPEMEACYLPRKADFDRVSAWLVSQGFKLTLIDSNHTNVFARGSVAQISAAFGVTFARVATVDGEFSSAVTAPSLPADISGAVLGISGLQPHIRMHVPKPHPAQVVQFDGYITPADVLAGYNVPGNLDGTGQAIAIIMGASPLQTDLNSFWTDIGSGESQTYTLVPIDGGPTPSSQSGDLDEVTLDAEWSTGMAPKAQLMVYAIPDLAYFYLTAACDQIMNDNVAKVASFSAGGDENGATLADFSSNSQAFAQMAAAGITMLASSGDGGSNPDTADNGYHSSNPLSVEYPACDPNVTGVGGTTLSLNASWVYTGEVAWNQISGGAGYGTGGGVSGIFARPSWQHGTGVPSGTMRCVPDVAAMSIGDYNGTLGIGALVILNGGVTGFGGTSLASPMWAGMVALMNQARANGGLQPVGLLGPGVYPLIGTSAFKDITSGNNGAYSAGTGYDLCTGVGSPNLTNLIAQIVPAPIGNIPNGAQALASVTTGNYNTADGYRALFGDTAGSNNSGVGSQALYSNVTGSQNVALGFRTLFANTTGTYNTANGYDSLPANTSGSQDTASGFKSMFFNTTGSDNTGHGYRTLFANTVGSDNTALGFNALQANTTGNQGTAAGSQALYSSTTGPFNTAVGFQALYANTTGSDNTAGGAVVLYSNTTGAGNTAAGWGALYSNTTGTGNTARGNQALYDVTTGYDDTASGAGALTSDTTGFGNTSRGFDALYSDTVGSNNTADGYQALYDNTSGQLNTAVGYQALFGNATGGSNTALGQGAGSSLTTGSNNIDIGHAGVAGEDSVIRIGASQAQTFIAGIAGATASGGTAVYIDPATGQLGTLTSSQRYKEDIQDMASASEAVLALRPVTFRYRTEIDPRGTPQFGLVAEEVETVSADLVVRDAGNRAYSVRYEAVNAMLLNEFRRQHERVDAQARIIGELARRAEDERSEIAVQRERLAALLDAQRLSAARRSEIEALSARLLAAERAAGNR